MSTYDDPRWEAFKTERDRFQAAVDVAISAAVAIATNTDSPVSALLKQRYAAALPKLTWLRNEVLQ